MDQVDLPNENLLIAVHGALMIIAWIGASSIGIFAARHLKKWNTQYFHMEQWFLWHRVFMALTWTLSTASFIIIFVDLDGWSTSVHAILGLVTTAIAFFHPILAMFRPLPNHPKRKYFNWAHMLAGLTAHIFALITIFASTRLKQLQFLDDAFIWVLFGFLMFHIMGNVIMAKINEGVFSKQTSIKMYYFYGFGVTLFTISLVTLVSIAVTDYRIFVEDDKSPPLND